MTNQVPSSGSMNLTPIDNPADEDPTHSHPTGQNHEDRNPVHPGSSSLCSPLMTWSEFQPSVCEESYSSAIFRAFSGIEFSAVDENLNLERGESSGHRLSQSDVTPLVEKATTSQGVKRPKRTRSAETHNRSERRRRDRISGKLKTLQDLIPNCHKANQAAMLDEAIQYLKSLKQQVDVMSVGGSRGGSILNQPPFKMSPMTQYPQSIQNPLYAPPLPSWPARMQLPTENLFPLSSVTNLSPLGGAASGFQLPHEQVPFNPVQPTLASAAVQPQLLPTYNRVAFNLPDQVAYTYRQSQNVVTHISCGQPSHMPTTGQESTNSSVMTVQRGSHRIDTTHASGRTNTIEIPELNKGPEDLARQ